MNNELKTKILNILNFDFPLRPHPPMYNMYQTECVKIG
jgi:hypothetical protein